LRFADGPHGKPALASATADRNIRFNLSHTDDLAVIAVSTRGDIGTDLERVRSLPRLQQLVSDCLSANEQSLLAGLPPGEQTDAFFQLWTRKEAVLKGCGRGITSGLALLDVSAGAGLGGCPEYVSVRLEDGTEWIIQDFKPAPSYRAALAVEVFERWPGGAEMWPTDTPDGADASFDQSPGDKPRETRIVPPPTSL
jgi:4'-phosphopantetheinyl transferase